MHPATALMSVPLVGGMVSVIMSPAALTHDSSALGDAQLPALKSLAILSPPLVSTQLGLGMILSPATILSCRSWLGWVNMLIGLCHNLCLPWALVRCWA